VAKITSYQGLLEYLNRVESPNGRPISWAQERLMTMAMNLRAALPAELSATFRFEIVWKNKPKAGGYRKDTLEFDIRPVGLTGKAWGDPQRVSVKVPS
jgi:hypothetical protein